MRSCMHSVCRQRSCQECWRSPKPSAQKHTKTQPSRVLRHFRRWQTARARSLLHNPPRRAHTQAQARQDPPEAHARRPLRAFSLHLSCGVWPSKAFAPSRKPSRVRALLPPQRMAMALAREIASIAMHRRSASRRGATLTSPAGRLRVRPTRRAAALQCSQAQGRLESSSSRREAVLGAGAMAALAALGGTTAAEVRGVAVAVNASLQARAACTSACVLSLALCQPGPDGRDGALQEGRV